MRYSVVVAVLLSFYSYSSTAQATTWHIFSDGTGDAPNIQAGIDSAANGDTVLVAGGTFSGVGNRDISFSGKVIKVLSEDGASATTVDAMGLGRCFAFESGEPPESHLVGFTLTGGAKNQGGAIRINEASPLIRNCIFSHNQAFFSGGAIDLIGISTTARFEDCIFISNESAWGGAINSTNGEPVFIRCMFLGNVASNAGGVFGGFEFGPGLLFESCSMYGNVAPDASVFLSTTASSLGRIENCIIAGNIGGSTFACDLAPIIDCTDIHGNSGGDWVGIIAGQLAINGNFSADPLFCDADLGDFTLHSDSPCAEGNHPEGAACGLIGVLDVECGPSTSVEATSWGRVKGMFR